MTTQNQINSSDLPLTGGTMSGNIAMGTNSITGLANPVNAQDAATKTYVDTIATGGAALCVCATTGALTATQAGAGVGATLTNSGAQAAFSVDGITPAVTSRVLVKNQTSSQNNGIYTLTNAGSGVTNWILTRAVDYNTPTDINDTGIIPVQSGTVNTNTGWVNTTINVTVDTTAITYVQFGATYPVSLANGGTGAALTASNGGIPYSNATTMALLSGTATAGLALLSGSSTTPTWSTKPPITAIASQSFSYTGSSQTYTPTTGMVYCIQECIGGGGAGGGVAATNTGPIQLTGGGGGAGGYSRKISTAAAIGASQTVTIGQGGQAGTAGNHPGGNGGDTSVGSICIAKGGTGGSGVATTGGATGGAGGVAGTGDLTLVGNSGMFGPAADSTVATHFTLTGGLGGVSHYGGQNQVDSTGSDNAGNYGSGGNGANHTNSSSSFAGGTGGNGYCIITEFISV